MTLEKNYQRINENIKEVIIKHIAKICFSSSTSRVFPKNKSKPIKQKLTKIKINKLLKIKHQKDFETWFEKRLDEVAVVIPKKTSKGKRTKHNRCFREHSKYSRTKYKVWKSYCGCTSN